MKPLISLLTEISLAELKQGFTFDDAEQHYTCLLCGAKFQEGVIYQEDGQFYEAKLYIRVHIEKQHGSVFHHLLELDKKLTGLTDHQKAILELLYAGASDNEIAKKMDAGSVSTIRNHKFSLREKQKQAKVLLALMELTGERAAKKQNLLEIPVPKDARLADNRLLITEEENEAIIHKYFSDGPDSELDRFPLKEKKRIAIVAELAKQFEPGKNYTEKEVNAILTRYYNDYAILRRYLIEYNFLDRSRDGRAYWVKGFNDLQEKQEKND